jgi:hypothetical protein
MQAGRRTITNRPSEGKSNTTAWPIPNSAADPQQSQANPTRV